MNRHFKQATLAMTILVVSGFALANPYLMGGLAYMAREYTGYGGTGGDGALTVSGTPNGPTNPIYTDGVRTYLTAAAAVGATTITVSSAASFTVGNEILIIQMLGTGIGNYETRTITSKAATTITFGTALTRAYTTYSAGVSDAQVIKIPNYTTISITSGGALSTHAFDGQTGGVMYIRASGNITLSFNATLSGQITVKGTGYAGGAASTIGSGPGGGAVATGGTNTSPGSAYTTAVAGSGGGGSTGAGGIGGGLMIVKSTGTATLDGNLVADGKPGAGTNGGGGAGGTIIFSSATITRTTTCGTISAAGGAGNGTGTAGGSGRIFLNFLTTLNCTNATPSTNATYKKYQVQ